MSDAFIGAIIGGLIAALPGLVTALLGIINSNAQRKHELTLRRIEIYETERRDALLQFGSVLFQSIRNVNASEYYSALGRASAFLPNDIVQKAYDIGYAIRQSNKSGNSSNIDDYWVEEIRSYIYQQFSRSLPAEGKKPSCTRTQKRGLKDT